MHIKVLSILTAASCIQKYTAHVKSVLPVLLSAIRISPPADGPAHEGKVIGKDFVTYSYEQVIHASYKLSQI